jgi:hypothetical protein
LDACLRHNLPRIESEERVMQDIQYTTVQQAQDRFKSQDVDSDTSLIKVLAGFPEIVLALVFGSIAKGKPALRAIWILL